MKIVRFILYMMGVYLFIGILVAMGIYRFPTLKYSSDMSGLLKFTPIVSVIIGFIIIAIQMVFYIIFNTILSIILARKISIKMVNNITIPTLFIYNILMAASISPFVASGTWFWAVPGETYSDSMWKVIHISFMLFIILGIVGGVDVIGRLIRGAKEDGNR